MAAASHGSRRSTAGLMDDLIAASARLPGGRLGPEEDAQKGIRSVPGLRREAARTLGPHLSVPAGPRISSGVTNGVASFAIHAQTPGISSANQSGTQ